MHLHELLVVQQAGGEANVDGRADFVARQHPHLDASLLAELDRVRHIILQSILNSRGANQGQVLLNHIIDLGDGLLAVFELRARLLLQLVPIVVGVLVNRLLRQVKGTEAILGVVFHEVGRLFDHVLLVLFLRVEPLYDHVVGAFAVENDFFGFHVFQDATLPLSRTGKLARVQQLPLFPFSIRERDGDDLL